MSLILAIDQSTSGTKAILFNARGKILDKASRDHRQIYPRPGWVEHDAEEIWQNLLKVVREIVDRNKNKLNKLAGLSITNQRETVLVFDRKSGRPLHNAIVWQCRRGDSVCKRLINAGHGDFVNRKTGLRVDTYFSASKLAWLISNKPDVADKLRTGEAVVGTIDSYLIHRLTGGTTFATDFTNASRTLLFDIESLKWDSQLCRLFKVPIKALPEIRESADHFGETDCHGILPSKVPIIGVMGDSQASLFAQGCLNPGSAKATFGTGTSVMLNIGSQFRTSKKGAVTALAWVLNRKPTYAFEGLINFSAATIEWLRTQIGIIQSVDEVESLARRIPDNGGVYLVPAFAGLNAPHSAPDARAAIIGMTAFTRREHIVRAAQEAIAYQIRDVLEMMHRDAGVKLKVIHADGGPTRNNFLMQFTADITGAELCVPEVAESSAWGAALNGLIGLGKSKLTDTAAGMSCGAKVFRPRMKAAEVVRNYEGWLAAVRRVL